MPQDHDIDISPSTRDVDEVEAPETYEAVAEEHLGEEPSPPVAESLEDTTPDEEAASVRQLDTAVAEHDVEAEVEDDEEEEEEEDSRFLPGDWYVVHTYAGYENRVRANLFSRIASMNMEDKIYDVVIPTEEVMEIKSGRKQVVQKKVFPGYILVRMTLDDDSWYVVRNTPGVTGFVGPGAKPQPLSLLEADRILTPQKPGEGRAKTPRLEFDEGEVVRVVQGAFQNMSGPIAEINFDQQRVKVLIDIFGRETPVELAFDQVAKL